MLNECLLPGSQRGSDTSQRVAACVPWRGHVQCTQPSPLARCRHFLIFTLINNDLMDINFPKSLYALLIISLAYPVMSRSDDSNVMTILRPLTQFAKVR